MSMIDSVGKEKTRQGLVSQIRDAEDRQKTGDSAQSLVLLMSMREADAERKRARNREWLRRRGRDKEIREKFQKMIDALTDKT